MLSILFVGIISFFSLSSNSMNLLKDALFSSSNRRKSKRSDRNPSTNYTFLHANNSLIDRSVYHFENNDMELGLMDSDDESNPNETPRASPPRTRHVRQNFLSSAHTGGSLVIVEKPVLPNETIQAFAIRYRVPVAQLKRINNLQNDQEFYALTSCRVPVRRFGVLDESSSSTLVDIDDQSTISLPVTHLSQQNHHAFLNAMDQDLAMMRTKVEQLIETPTDDVLRQSTTTSRERLKMNSKDELKFDGADCGCRLWHIVLIILLIVLIPLIGAYFYIQSQRT